MIVSEANGESDPKYRRKDPKKVFDKIDKSNSVSSHFEHNLIGHYYFSKARNLNPQIICWKKNDLESKNIKEEKKFKPDLFLQSPITIKGWQVVDGVKQP